MSAQTASGATRAATDGPAVVGRTVVGRAAGRGAERGGARQRARPQRAAAAGGRSWRPQLASGAPPHAYIFVAYRVLSCGATTSNTCASERPVVSTAKQLPPLHTNSAPSGTSMISYCDTTMSDFM